jgi:hypothetical protein
VCVSKAMAKPYGDIGKEARDVLSQDFLNEGVFRISHTSKTKDNINVKTTFSRSNPNGKETVTAVLEPKFDLNPNVELNFKLSTNKDVTAGVVGKNLGVDGLKLEASGTQSEKDGLTLNINGSFSNSSLNGKISLTAPLSSQKYKLTEEVAFKFNPQTHIGLKGVYGVADGSIDLFPAIAYTQGDHVIVSSAQYGVTSKKSSVSLSTHSKLTPAVKLGSDAKYELNPAKNGELASLNFGLDYKLNTKTSLKAKGKGIVFANTNKDARFSLAAKHQLTPSTTLVVGADIGLTGALGFGPSTNSFGIEIKID